MSETREAAKRIYTEMNAAMEVALTKVAQRFNADDWDALARPEHKDNHKWTEEDNNA